MRPLTLLSVAAALLAVLHAVLFPAKVLRHDGEVVVITGASSGIGAELARQYGAAGARVVIAARRRAELDKVVAETLAAGAPDAFFVAADMGKAEDCERLVAEALARFGGIDTLVINHAMFDDGLFLAMNTSADLDATLLAQYRVNVMGAAYTIRAALPALEASARGGRLIEVSSGSIRIPVPFHPGYGTTKTALHGFVRHMSTELQLVHSPLRVTTAILGMIGTPEVLVHEGLRALAYSVHDTARDIIIAAQGKARKVFVPYWVGYGAFLSFFSETLEDFFMSEAYTFKIPEYRRALAQHDRAK
jgi:NAD(P)-dependent dehydrogenase (short-subunit alcohol dehydrogenase family)